MPVLAIAAVMVAASVATSVYSSSASSTAAKKASGAAEADARSRAALTGTGNPLTTVDPNAGVNQLGRAALISTSPQGVSGTDPSMRYRLLGNTSGLGNN